MKNIIVFIVLNILIVGCVAKNPSNSIDLDRNDLISILDIVDSINVVALETKNECLIGNISKLITYNNRYYIFDVRLQTIFCFDKEGLFLFKIAQRGRGPEEYTYLEDFNIDPYNHQLMLLVPYGEILYFDLDGCFISKVMLPSTTKAYNEIYALNSDELFFISLSEYQATYYSRKKEKILKEIFPIEEPRYFTPTERTFSYNDSIYFNSILGKNEVMNMSDVNHKVVYSWNFGEKNNTSKQISILINYLKLQEQNRTQRPDLKDLIGDGKFLNYYIYNSFESNRYRMAILEYNNDILLVFADKREKKDFVFRRTIEGIQLYFSRLYNESIILWNYDTDLTYYNKSLLSPEQLKIVEAYNPNKDNPLLLIYSLKQ